MSVNLLELLSVSAHAAELASAILHDVVERGEHRNFQEKTGPKDVVTIADGRAQELIVGALNACAALRKSSRPRLTLALTSPIVKQIQLEN